MPEATKTRAPRRTAEQLAAEAQANANRYRAKADKAKRAVETRQKVIVGSGLMGLAKSGDVEAMRVLERVKANLTRQQDRAAFGLTEAVPSTPSAPTAEMVAAADAAIREALAAHKAVPETDRSGRRETQLAWRGAVAAWERTTGKMRFDGEKRREYGFGDFGEVSPRKPGEAHA